MAKGNSFSEFVEGVSCLHADGKPGWVYCGKCNTACKRNSDGVIIDYTRGTADRPAQETNDAQR